MSLVHTSSRFDHDDHPYLTITMTGSSHDVEIELFDNSSDDGYEPLRATDDTSSQGEDRSSSLDQSDESIHCSESLASPASVAMHGVGDDYVLPNVQDHSKKSRSFTSSTRSSPSSGEGSSTARIRSPPLQSYEGKKVWKEKARSEEQDGILDEHAAPDEPRKEVSRAEDSTSDPAIRKIPKIVEPTYLGGLSAIREIDSDSARSPTLASPKLLTSTLPRKCKSHGSITLLDRFGRHVWLHHNDEDEMDEVRVDEDGHYYVFGDEGLRMRLKEGQVQSKNTSQPFCISGGKKVNINIVPDRLRISALQDPRPAADEDPTTPRTEPAIDNASNPLLPPIRKTPRPAAATRTQRGRTHSRNPWAGLFTGVAEKSKHATTYLTKGARSKMRSSGSQPVPEFPSQQSSSRISSRASSANKSALETRNSGETRGRRTPLLGQVTPVAGLKKKILSRRS